MYSWVTTLTAKMVAAQVQTDYQAVCLQQHGEPLPAFRWNLRAIRIRLQYHPTGSVIRVDPAHTHNMRAIYNSK